MAPDGSQPHPNQELALNIVIVSRILEDAVAMRAQKRILEFRRLVLSTGVDISIVDTKNVQMGILFLAPSLSLWRAC